jgi:hypothetical protein
VPQDHTCHKQSLELLLLPVVGRYIAHAHSLVSATPVNTCHKIIPVISSSLNSFFSL